MRESQAREPLKPAAFAAGPQCKPERPSMGVRFAAAGAVSGIEVSLV